MADVKKELVTMLNKALELEHAARIQYLAHAELVSGLYAEPVIARIKEIAGDEEKHEGMLRELIGDYLDDVPTMDLAETHHANDIEAILKINIKDEKVALDLYSQIYKKVVDNKNSLNYIFEKMEHQIRHIILDEQEHVVELNRLLNQ